MKKIITLIIVTYSFCVKAQNVGINGTGAVPNISAMLDVTATNKGILIPRVALVSNTDAVTIPIPATGLMVFNTTAGLACGTGYYYNSGTPASPVWTCFTKQQQIFQLYGTAARLAVTSNIAAAQPGLSQTIIVPAGASVQVTVMGDIGVRNTSTSVGQYSIVDAIIYLNGTFLPQGGWNRYETLNSSSYSQNSFGVIPLSCTFTLAAGTHTITIRTARFGGNTSVDIGGNCALDTNCGEFSIFVNYL